MSEWWGRVLLVAGAVVALTAFVDLYAGFRSRRPTWSVWRLGLGCSLVLLTVGLGGALVTVDTEEPPEQLGIAVVVDGVKAIPERGFDLGLFVAANVTVTSCETPVTVRLTLEPSAEFWTDHRKELRDGGRVDFGIPDDDVDIEQVLVGQEPGVPLPRAGTSVVDQREVTGETEIVDGVTKVSVDVPDWGRTFDPVTVVFEAEWAETRSRLGGCYVSLPALTGLPTVVTASRMSGVAWSDPDEAEQDPEDDSVLFRVTSTNPERYAVYDPELEVTRGATTVDVGDYAIDASRSSPAPTTTIQGTPAWTCRSAISTLGFLASGPNGPVPDYAFNQSGAGAFSGSRMDAVTGQPSCGSLLALEDAHYGTKRDLGLIIVGALFSVGVELLMSAFRRRDRPAATSQD